MVEKEIDFREMKIIGSKFPKGDLKRGSRSRIEWCDETWNPVIGCRKGCDYCYARSLARRFGVIWAKSEMKFGDSGRDLYDLESDLLSFVPTFMWSNFYKKFRGKSRLIFVNSMSDPSCWPEEWMIAVMEQMAKWPDKKFVMLTKDPEYVFPKAYLDNLYTGFTVTQGTDMRKFRGYGHSDQVVLNIEPLLGDFGVNEHLRILDQYKWVIIGPETGRYRKNVVRPKWDWIKDLVFACENLEIPVFMKDKMRGVVPPWAFAREMIDMEEL